MFNVYQKLCSNTDFKIYMINKYLKYDGDLECQKGNLHMLTHYGCSNLSTALFIPSILRMAEHVCSEFSYTSLIFAEESW